MRLYLVRREGRATLRIDCAAKVVAAPHRRLVFVRLCVVNASSVMLRRATATITFFAAVSDASTHDVVLRPLAHDDPFIPVTGYIDPRTSLVSSAPIRGLEPAECVQSEVMVAVPVDTEILAVRVAITGLKRATPFRRTAHGWRCFAFIDTTVSATKYVPLTIRASGEQI